MKKNKNKNKPIPQSKAVSKVDSEAAALAEENGEAAEEREADAVQADKVEAAKTAEATREAAQEAAAGAAAVLKAAREAVKAAKAKVRELGKVPTCTSEAIRLACLYLDCSTEDWEVEMEAAGYGELNKAAPAMLNQVRVVTRHLRNSGHMLPVFETAKARYDALVELTADAENAAKAEAVKIAEALVTEADKSE